MTTDFDNREAQEFLRLFVNKKDGQRKSFSEVKRNIAATLDSYEAEDLYNEYIAIFIEILNRYVKKEGINFVRFFSLYLRFLIRNWICRVSRNPLFHTVQPEDEETKMEHLGVEITFWKFRKSQRSLMKKLPEASGYLRTK